MGMFLTRRPRGFRHTYIYADERKERLARMEEKAKRDLGLLPPLPCDPEALRGKFREQTKHLRRRKPGTSFTFSRTLLALLAVAALIGLWSIL